MLNIKPTRSELLHTKKRIVLAKKGHDLLKKKQDSLIIEFFRLLKEIKEQLKNVVIGNAKEMKQVKELLKLLKSKK